ncbi:MAG: PQQ-like beta-propeller repeat protein, partial [Propionibacteriaceae bacterium]|nr:PQQ-like beta-propeller repeat protein [Propionibacteriaceae bacterium]
MFQRPFAIALSVVAAVVMVTGCTPAINDDPVAKFPPPPTATPTPSPSWSPTAMMTPVPAFEPHATDTTDPAKFGLRQAIQVNGTIVDSYQRPRPVDFALGDDYTPLPGIITFRGGPLRDSPSYGTAQIAQKQFSKTNWSVPTGGMKTGLATWSGSGWTGQPLLVQWPDETRKVLQRDQSAIDKGGLIEAIYATMDGHVYFLDAETGQQTRKAVSLGFPFKGAGALDPRGIPLLYVGSGDNSPGGAASHVFIVSLVDGKVLYEFGGNDSFAQRGWSGMDSSPLVDAATDTLIYCGENGVVYTIHLNTQWDQATGSLTINPDEVVKYRYSTSRTSSANYWLGIESSPVIISHYLIAGDNGGNLICLDLNTMSMVWMQDIWDDTNDTPVVEIGDDGKPYVYISTSLHWTSNGGKGTIPVWKIDATNGEKVWQHDYPCYTIKDLSGGVQGTIAIGQNNVADLVFVPISRTPSIGSGRLAALDKNTGNEVWVFDTPNYYSWSSPVPVYDAAGHGYLIYCNSAGTI